MSVEKNLIQARRDASLRTKLEADDGVKRAHKKIAEETSGYGFYGRRRLLTGALRMSRFMAPDVANAVDECREILGFQAPIEVYIKPDAQYGAFIMKQDVGPLAMCLTSRLVEGFTPAEHRFVIGHEMGHALFDHLSLPMPLTATIEDMAGTLVSRSVSIELYLWCRSAEISADRAGLACARDLNAAASSFLKLSSGLSRAEVSGDLTHYMSQVDALASSPVARQKPRDDDDTLECFSTHPYAPLRVRALVAYAKSDAFEKVQGRTGLTGGMKIDDAEAIVERDLELMEPSYLEEKNQTSDTLRRLLYTAGLAVAAASGGVEPAELEAIGRLLGSDHAEEVTDADKVIRDLDGRIHYWNDSSTRL
jgi:hypothetical protein